MQVGLPLQDFESLLRDELPDTMTPYLYVFLFRVYDRIPHEVYCSLRVAKQDRSHYGFREVCVLSVAARLLPSLHRMSMYSASVVGSAVQS